jgi:hypothetical protein
MAVAAAESNPVVQQKLGEPLKVGFLTSGSMEISGTSMLPPRRSFLLTSLSIFI